MDKRLEKYFWDGKEGITDTFFVRRIVEYGAFPDILKLPLEVFVKEIKRIDIDKLRTSDKRKRFLKLLLPHLDNAGSWKELILKMAIVD